MGTGSVTICKQEEYRSQTKGLSGGHSKASKIKGMAFVFICITRLKFIENMGNILKYVYF